MDRRSEIVQSPNRYELTSSSDKSNSLSRDAGSYDIIQAEARAKNDQDNIINNNNNIITNGNGTSTLESIDNDVKKKKWPTDKSYFYAKELLMTERTYKKDLDVINTVIIVKLHKQKSISLTCSYFSGYERNCHPKILRICNHCFNILSQ